MAERAFASRYVQSSLAAHLYDRTYELYVNGPILISTFDLRRKNGS